ncbi:hypothetical protein BGL63_02120 [Helicobacter pylori]|nr:hypothetical protein BGL63_02120 [Helicobacter pylori]
MKIFGFILVGHWQSIDVFEYFSHLKKACEKRVIVSHNVLLWGYGGFSFGFEKGVKVQNTPLFSYEF